MPVQLIDYDRATLPGPLAAITTEHRFTLRVLALVEQEADELLAGRRPDVRLLREALHFCTHVLDRVHHPREELIFEQLQAVAEEKIQTAVTQLSAGHDELSRAGDELLQVLAKLWFAWGKRRRVALGHLLAEYCSSLRMHMRAEETVIYEPAIALLTANHWSEIENQLAAFPGAICGIDKTPEYSWLLERHLNHVTTHATGALPYAMVNKVSSAAERTVHTSLAFARIPARMLRLTKRQASQLAREFRGVRDVSSALDVLGSVSQSWRDGQKAARKMIKESARSGYTPQALEEDSATPVEPLEVRTLRSEDELMHCGEKVNKAPNSAATSWQAAVANVAFRITLKPMLALAALPMAKTVEGQMRRSKTVPPGFKMSPEAENKLRARRIRPAKAPARKRVIMYLPGGAFIFPASGGHTRILAYLSKRTRAEGIMVDYRLAPDHPFPAGLEDAIEVYRHLLQSGVEARDIAIAGDSAGGGLTLSLLFALREQGLPMPACAACLSPLTDMSFSGPSHKSNSWRDSLLPSDSTGDMVQIYAADACLDNPLISPIFGDFAGLPPLIVQASSSEILLDDSLRLARKARAQGVDVRLQLWESLPHAWQVFSFLPESRAALRQVSQFFDEQFTIREARRTQSLRSAAHTPRKTAAA